MTRASSVPPPRRAPSLSPFSKLKLYTTTVRTDTTRITLLGQLEGLARAPAPTRRRRVVVVADRDDEDEDERRGSRRL